MYNTKQHQSIYGLDFRTRAFVRMFTYNRVSCRYEMKANEQKHGLNYTFELAIVDIGNKEKSWSIPYRKYL